MYLSLAGEASNGYATKLASFERRSVMCENQSGA